MAPAYVHHIHSIGLCRSLGRWLVTKRRHGGGACRVPAMFLHLNAGSLFVTWGRYEYLSHRILGIKCGNLWHAVIVQ